MRSILLSALLVVLSGSLSAQDCEVVGVSKGQLFSARLTVQSTGETKEFFHHLQADPVRLGELPPGVYRIRTAHLRFGWPQYGAFVISDGDREVRRTEATYEPVRIELKTGQKLTVEFPRSYEPYDGKYFTVAGVPAAIVLPRPYWYQDVSPGQFRGNEAFPNSLFFLVDDEWGFGEMKLIDALAKFAAAQIKAGVAQEDFRRDHLSINIALAPDGNLQPVLTAMDEGTLAAELRQGLTRAWEDMKSSKCYRPFDGQSGAPIMALKNAGFLPADWPDDRVYISLAEGLELAKPLAKRWRQEHPDRKP
jgi:hypothetical protein